MSQSELDKVKLVSLKVGKFKTLEEETIFWEHDADNLLDVINVQDFHRMYFCDILK